MNRQIKEMKIIVDGKLEKELYFIPKKNSTRVFGSGVIPSGEYLIPFFRTRIIAENSIWKKYNVDGNKVKIESSTYTPIFQ